MLCLLLVV